MLANKLRSIAAAVPLAAFVSLSCSAGEDAADAAPQRAAGSAEARTVGSPPRLPASDSPRDVGLLKLVQARIQAIERFPKSGEAWGRLGQVYDAHDGLDGDFADLAVECYARAAALAPDVFRWPYLAGTLVERRSKADALAWFDRALAADAELGRRHAPLFVQRSIARLGIGDVEGAREDSLVATRTDASLVLGWMSLARVELVDDDPLAALAALERAQTAGPQADEIHGLLAEAYRRRGDNDAAAGELALMLDGGQREQLPDRLRAEAMIEGISIDWAQARSGGLLEVGRVDDAVAVWQRVIEYADPLEAHFRLADLLIRAGRPDEARAVLAALETRLQSPGSRPEDRAQLEFQMGVLAMGLRRVDDAIVHFEAAVVFDASHTLARGNLGLALATRGDLTVGLGHLRRACAELDDAHSMQVNLIGILNRARLWDELSEVLDHYEDASGETGYTCFTRGGMLASQQLFEGAAAAFARAAELEPANERAVTNHARALRRLGRTGDAIDVLHAGHARLHGADGGSAAPATGMRIARDLAWALATTVDDGLVDGPEATRLAQWLLELSPQNPSYLDLLAAAQAASEEFASAVINAGLAIEALQQSTADEAPPDRAQVLLDMAARRDTYESLRRWTQ